MSTLSTYVLAKSSRLGNEERSQTNIKKEMPLLLTLSCPSVRFASDSGLFVTVKSPWDITQELPIAVGSPQTICPCGCSGGLSSSLSESRVLVLTGNFFEGGYSYLSMSSRFAFGKKLSLSSVCYSTIPVATVSLGPVSSGVNNKDLTHPLLICLPSFQSFWSLSHSSTFCLQLSVFFPFRSLFLALRAFLNALASIRERVFCHFRSSFGGPFMAALQSASIPRFDSVTGFDLGRILISGVMFVGVS